MWPVVHQAVFQVVVRDTRYSTGGERTFWVVANQNADGTTLQTIIRNGTGNQSFEFISRSVDTDDAFMEVKPESAFPPAA
jgi:hypothetical protein